jgi:hypothetical protein
VDASGLLFVAIIGATLFGCFGHWIARMKRMSPGVGALVGAVFGPIGVLVLAMLPDGVERSEPRPQRRSRVASDDPLGRDIVWLKEAENRAHGGR